MNQRTRSDLVSDVGVILVSSTFCGSLMALSVILIWWAPWPFLLFGVLALMSGVWFGGMCWQAVLSLVEDIWSLKR